MMYLYGNISKSKYAWELVAFNKVRELSDGITFFNVNINYDKYEGDHTPRFEFSIEMFNYTLIEFSFYNIYHADHPHYR